MEPLIQSAPAQNKSRLARTFTKVLHIRKTKLPEKEKAKHDIDETKFFNDQDEKYKRRATMDAFIAKVFATISSVKAAYAQLQYAQTPYDADGIQSADQILVSELKSLSEFKQSFMKKHLDDDSPETTQLLAEIQEQKNLLQMYEITTKTFDSQKKLKDSEIIFLKEKLNEANKENKLIERRLNWSGLISPHEKLTLSSLSPKTFVLVLYQTRKSVTSFVKLMMDEMEAANWDLNVAASSIQPEVIYPDTAHICYAFESFAYQVMFAGFNSPSFSINNDSDSQGFYDKFIELKSLKASEYITWKPNSTFAKFCYSKYLKLVHPIMEFSLFGNLNQRNLAGVEKFPETTFFESFANMAKQVWLLHCLAFALDPNKSLSVFQLRKGSRFSEVYMESVNEEPVKTSPEVAFTVIPGFKLGKTVIQCQVYLT